MLGKSKETFNSIGNPKKPSWRGSMRESFKEKILSKALINFVWIK